MSEEELDDTEEMADAQEVPLHEWASFLQEVTKRRGGARVTLEQQSTDATGSTSAIADGLPLAGLVFDSADGEEGTIQIMLGDTLTHVVEEPTYVWHYQDGDTGEVIEIEDADGQTIRVRFVD